MAGHRRFAFAVFAVLALVATGCGDDDDNSDKGTVTVTLTDNGFQGVPTELPSGVLTVTFTNNSSGSSTLDLIRVGDDVTEDEFRSALATATSGGAIADSLQAVSGVGDTAPGASTTASFEVKAGKHFLAAEPTPPEEEGGPTDTAAAGAAPTTVASSPTTTGTASTDEGAGEEGPPPESFIVQPVTVTDDDSGLKLPATDGTITAKDYSFDVDVKAGQSLTFRNEGPVQFHVASLVGFGNTDPSVVEQNLPTLLASEGDSAPPPGIDPSQVNFEVGTSEVMSPGLGGTFAATLQPGTYAVVCFLQDRTGGEPHALARNMFKVFTVS